MRKFILLIVAVATVLSSVRAEPDPAYVCSACLIVLGLVEQAAFQVHLESALAEKCGDSKICQSMVKELIKTVELKAVPEDVCKEISACTDDCKLFSQWPVDPLPPQPPAWPIERRSLSEMSTKDLKRIPDDVWELDVKRDLKILRPFFEALVSDIPEEWGMWAHGTFALAKLFLPFHHSAQGQNALAELKAYPEDCGFNISCHIQHIVDHKPIQDNDGDFYSMEGVRRLRGTDWRGVDCDDSRVNVYPGRHVTAYDGSVDHNCNGISGGNETGLYEDLFCAGTQPRGIAILGDSATAHFHIPPQWLTAQGWNLDQLLPDALNEIDQPQCSWGTAHVDPELCPYQYPIPGVNGVLSLYTQLRQRNRCNHNDYQNIGVNGARVTSSMQLANALARDQQNDNPLLVYFALIGNDICNGHPNFDSMTEPDEFYEKAMATFNELDKVLPANSYVVAVAIFDGELLYQIMHNHVHPLGTKYVQAYDFMNCLEENPCWGWLNSNETVRRISTQRSNELNRVYQNISDTQNFNNFKFIFFNPHWAALFNDYYKSGAPLTDLIEPSDGFHPSQTGNAIFAQKFFEFLETEHPEALGPVNPHNEEIDRLFFSSPAKK